MVARRVVVRHCGVCEAEWTARKSAPPAKCPRCQAPYSEAAGERRAPREPKSEDRERILARLRERVAHIPPGVSLSEELISERRHEAQREAAAQ